MQKLFSTNHVAADLIPNAPQQKLYVFFSFFFCFTEDMFFVFF